MSLNQQIDAHALFSGWLYKKGVYNKSWKKRFFVLYDDRTIHYYAEKSHSSTRNKAKGKIHLTQIQRVELVAYTDPNNKRIRKSTFSPSPHAMICKTASLHNNPSLSYSHLSRSSYAHYNDTQNRSTFSLAPSILTSFTKTTTQSTQQKQQHQMAPAPAQAQAYNSHSTHLQQRRIDRSSSIGNLSSSSISTFPLQSISELESVDSVHHHSLDPYSLNSFNSMQQTASHCIPHIPPRHISPLHGVNGWSFDNDNENYYISTPSIISSSQPPPNYDEIIQNEENKYLDASLLQLKQSYYDRNTMTPNTENIFQEDTKSEPISRRHSANAALIKLDLYADVPHIQNQSRPSRRHSISHSHSHMQQPLTLQSSSTTTIQSVSNVIQPKKHSCASIISYSYGDQSTSQSTDTVECELSDNELDNDLSRSRYAEDKDIILSVGIRSHKDSLSTECSQYDTTESKKDEYDIFQAVMGDTHLGLDCDRRYSFALIHPNRQYILSAQTKEELKEWISIFSKLTQGKPVFSGYLLLLDNKKENLWNKRFFILFENKVLNYYKDHNDVNNGKSCEFDIDLRHVMWLRYCPKNEFGDKIKLTQYFARNTDRLQSAYYLSTPSGNSVINPLAKRRKRHSVYSLEIAIPNRLFIITADSIQTRNEWYHQIRDVFGDTLILKRYYDSPVLNIYMVHSDSHYKNRYIAFFGGIGLVIFQDKTVWKAIKRMTFFDDMVFKDYIRKKHCTIIPINNNVNVRRATSNHHGKRAFVVSNHYDERKWYFDCTKKQILDKWIYLLVDKRWMSRRKPLQTVSKHKNKNKQNKLQIPSLKSRKRKKKKKRKTQSYDLALASTSYHESHNNYDEAFVSPKQCPVSIQTPVSPYSKPEHNIKKSKKRRGKLVRRHSNDVNQCHYIDTSSFYYNHSKTKRSTSIGAHDLSNSKDTYIPSNLNIDAMFQKQF